MTNVGITIFQLFIFCLWPLAFAFIFGYYKNQPEFSKKILYGSNSIFLGIIIAGSSVAIKLKVTGILQPNTDVLDTFEGISLLCTSLIFLLFYLNNTLDENNPFQLTVVTYWHYSNRALLTTLQMCALTSSTTIGYVILGFFIAHLFILFFIIFIF